MPYGSGAQGAATEPGDVLLAGTVLGGTEKLNSLEEASQLWSGGVY